MAKLIDVSIPDIGDVDSVEVIEVLVKPGDVVKPEQSLITVESDKASMEIPSSHGGTVKSLSVKVGDKVKKGVVILKLDSDQADPAPQVPAAQGVAVSGADANASLTQASANGSTASNAQGATPMGSSVASVQLPPAAGSTDVISSAAIVRSDIGAADMQCDLLVLGAGPGGYSAAFRAADLGLNVVLVERYTTLGGVCLNVGCIPSKALLHATAVLEEAKSLASHGISFGEPSIDLDKLRAFKDGVIGKLTGGLAGMAKARKVTVVTGTGEFLDAYHLEIQTDAGKKIVRFSQAIIAAGSQSVKLPFMPDDPRVVDSTGALMLGGIPKKMLIVGGGIIGLEMGTVYSALGSRLDVVEMMDGLMQGADRDLVKVWQKRNSHRFDNLYLQTKTVGATAKKDGIYVTFDGTNAPKEPQRYDIVLQAVGRTPNGKRIGAERAGIAVTDRGFIPVDRQMRTNIPHIFAIGDVVGQPMLAHKAVHEAHVAAEAAAGQKSYFDVRVIPSVAYTDPEVAWVGLTEDQAKSQGINVTKGVFPWAASGRAIANGRDEGVTKLLFDADTHKIVGGGIVGTHAGDLIGEVALAIEMGADAVDIGKTIHPHPTLGESIGLAAEASEGHCTDLPPQRKK